MSSAGFIYLLNAGEYWKIGKTTNPDARLERLAIQLPFPCEQLGLFGPMSLEGMDSAEKDLHRRFSERRVNGEWFKLTHQDVWSIISVRFPSSNNQVEIPSPS